jgi:hypothetical protein
VGKDHPGAQSLIRTTDFNGIAHASVANFVNFQLKLKPFAQSAGLAVAGF